MDYKLIGQQVRAVRKSRNLTQAALAERADLSIPYISHIERGRKKVSLDALVRIANGLDMTVDQLLSGNQAANQTAYFPEVQELLADCTLQERKIIWDVAVAIKESLHRNLQAA